MTVGSWGVGNHTYGDPAHVHATTALSGTGASYAYDAAGNMVCRAPRSSATCSGTQKGQNLTYDAEGRLRRRLAREWRNLLASAGGR
jgi:YD repeat-containing protein